MRTVRGHVVLLFIPNPWAYRIGGRGRTRLLASLVYERVVARFTKKLARAARGEKREASGDEHRYLRHSEIGIFALLDPRDGFRVFTAIVIR